MAEQNNKNEQIVQLVLQSPLLKLEMQKYSKILIW